MKIAVMRGDLEDFDLAQVLQVVSLGRQYTGVELTLPGDRIGTVFVKSGQVVSANLNGYAGRDAFRALFPEASGQFFVFRTATPSYLPEPLGRLDRLLLEAQEANEKADSRRTSPLPLELAATETSARTAAAELSAHRAEAAPAAAPTRPRAPYLAGHSPKSLGIVSPKGGSGKSTVALNLALSLARRGHSVVLVDGDVNGDILSAINARARAIHGALDVVSGHATVEQALLETVNPRLKLLPAVGERLPDPEVLALDPKGGWPRLIRELEHHADVVLVDTPSGVFGPTRPILGAVHHVLGVLQAEVVAARSFGRFSDGLQSLPDNQRPEVIGVVLNMLQTRHHASLSVFQDALQGLPGDWLLDTTIPRHPAFLEATHQGLPLRLLDEDAPPPVAFLFDNLAGEVAERLGLRAPTPRPQAFLL